MTALLRDLQAASHAARQAGERENLLDFARRYARARNPQWLVPFDHLAPIAEDLEEAFRCYRMRKRHAIRAVEHAAVQHMKTTLIQAFVLWCLCQDPRVRIGYGSYNNDRAEGKMWEVRQVAHRFGVQLSATNATKTKWYTEINGMPGGFVYAGSVTGGTWTGDGLDIIILDDLYKGREEADSAAHRNKVEKAIEDDILTRAQDHTPIIVNMARWNPQDASAYLIRKGWPYRCLPALDRGGRPLCPALVSLERLLLLRDGDPARGILPIHRRTWFALYQGDPRPDEGRIFDPAHLTLYDRLPEGAYVEALGLDLAYGARRANDHSALTVFRRYAHDMQRLYRVECHSAQQTIELYAMRVAETQLRRGGLQRALAVPCDVKGADAWCAEMAREDIRRARRIPGLWYTSTTEQGTAALLLPWGARVEARRAGVDKLARAQGTYAPAGAEGYTARWARGEIVVPAREESTHAERWRIAHEDFTGLDGCEDDEVDGAVAAHDLLAVPVVGREHGRPYAAGVDPWLAGGSLSGGSGDAGWLSAGGGGESWE